MSRPIFSVKYVSTASLLPATLERGRAYFVADEQVIIVDMGDGRGPVKYGDKPGPQGIAGEPLPQLQEQIDDLASASLLTSKNIYDLKARGKVELSQLHTELNAEINSLQESINTALDSIRDNTARTDEQTGHNAAAILTLLDIVKEKFAAYDDAINILARTVSNLYPASYRASVSSDTIPIAAGEIISVNGQRYIVDAASVDGNTGTATLTLYDSPEDTPRISTLSEGDTVTFDGGTFTVNTVSQQGDTGIMYDYITHCIKFTPHP